MSGPEQQVALFSILFGMYLMQELCWRQRSFLDNVLSLSLSVSLSVSTCLCPLFRSLSLSLSLALGMYA